MNILKYLCIATVLFPFSLSIASAQISDPVRTVQIRTVDFERQSIEVHNFGVDDQPLDGWRFCSHDEDQVRRYSDVPAFNGFTLLAGESLFLMYNNDASASNEFNINTLGNFALPLDTNGAYAIQFYFQTPFGVGSNIADHLQFSLDGADDGQADERSDEAIFGGVWLDENDWIPVTLETTSISIDEAVVQNDLHSSADYMVENPELVTVEVINNELIVLGTQGPDDINITQFGDQLEVDVDQGVVQSFDVQTITRVVVNGFGGADDIVANVDVPTSLFGGFGADLIIGGTETNELFGGPGADDITGGPLADQINSGRGQDFVNALGGDDFIIGGDANDELRGGPGDDRILGGLGADTLVGGNGNDVLVGNTGADTLLGGAGDDDLSGLGGADALNGGGGNDLLRGGAGFDTLNGSAGTDEALDVGEVEISIEI